MSNGWEPAYAAPGGVAVKTAIIEGKVIRQEQTMIRRGRLWFLPDHSMYVYYKPTHYRPDSAAGSAGGSHV